MCIHTFRNPWFIKVAHECENMDMPGKPSVLRLKIWDTVEKRKRESIRFLEEKLDLFGIICSENGLSIRISIFQRITMKHELKHKIT
jgi:hypothetical protein